MYLLKYYLEIGSWKCFKNGKEIYKQERLWLLTFTEQFTEFLFILQNDWSASEAKIILCLEVF